MQKTIVIDPGHGGKDPGACFGSLEEKTIVLFVCLDLNFRLKELNPNYQVYLTRPVDIYVSPKKRAEFANRVQADLFVSVHTNADPDPDKPGDLDGKGEEIWISNKSPKSMLAAQSIKLWVDMIFPGEPFRGIKESNQLTVLNDCNCPAILLEIGFIDKSSSLETFSSMKTLQSISKLICCGIDQYFIKKKGG